jgi:arylsulfatase A-like enzyme
VAKRLGSMTADGANPPWDALDAERRADLAGRMNAYAGMVSGMDRNWPLQRKEPLFFEHDGSRAVRDGKWKLVSARAGEWELYDIEADRTELNNLATMRPEKVRDLSARWDEWAKRTNVAPHPGNR